MNALDKAALDLVYAGHDSDPSDGRTKINQANRKAAEALCPNPPGVEPGSWDHLGFRFRCELAARIAAGFSGRDSTYDNDATDALAIADAIIEAASKGDES